MPWSTSAAATSSCVLSGLDAKSTSPAPPAWSVCIECAVSLVTWRQALIRILLSGFCFANRSRMLASTGMDLSAHSMRPCPLGARFRSFTWWAVFMCFLDTAMSIVPLGDTIAWCPRLDSGRAFEPRGLPQRVRAIGVLPGELGLGAAEMPVRSGLFVDRPQQIELADDRRRLERERGADRLLDLLLGNGVRSERLHHDRDRLRDSDGVCDLHLAASRQTRGNHVLRHPARRVGGAAVHLRGVLAGEGATAVVPHAPVGVDDALPSGPAALDH